MNEIKIGDLIRIKDEWVWLYYEFMDQVGIVTMIIEAPYTRAQFLMNGSYYVMQTDMLEVIPT